MTSESSNVRILSLDASVGEAQAGFAQIKIIRALMREVWKKKNTNSGEPTNNDINGMRPSDYFDIIFGSGTGGIIAVYLGRLHLTIEECERFYKGLGEEVYAHPHTIWNPFQYHYDYKRLESVLKEQTTSQDFADKNRGCKSVVLAKMSENNTLHLVQSYDIRSGKTWEAIRATTASYYNFPSVKVGPRVLFAAEAGYSNPAGVAWNEVRRLYPPPKREGVVCSPTRGVCLISVGGGARLAVRLQMQAVQSPQWSVRWWLYWAKQACLIFMALFSALFGRAHRLPQLQELAGVAAECESVDNDLKKRFNPWDQVAVADLGRHFVPEKSGYFRFNFDPSPFSFSEETQAIKPTPMTFEMAFARLRRIGTSMSIIWKPTDVTAKWNAGRLLMEKAAELEYSSQEAYVPTANKPISAAALLTIDAPSVI